MPTARERRRATHWVTRAKRSVRLILTGKQRDPPKRSKKDSLMDSPTD
jgi:hypothetical protein